MAAGVADPKIKRGWETHLQWQARLARLEAMERDRNEPLVPVEAERHAVYTDQVVMHVETNTRAQTKRNMTTSPFDDLYRRGTIDKDQYQASLEIAMVAEILQRPVSVRCASLEARVDNLGSARNLLIERLAHVQLEMVYSRWRQRLPVPRQLYLDMLLTPGSLFAKARSYRMGWPKARKRLIRALDNWNEIYDRIVREVDEEDVVAAHKRISADIIFRRG